MTYIQRNTDTRTAVTVTCGTTIDISNATVLQLSCGCLYSSLLPFITIARLVQLMLSKHMSYTYDDYWLTAHCRHAHFLFIGGVLLLYVHVLLLWQRWLAEQVFLLRLSQRWLADSLHRRSGVRVYQPSTWSLHYHRMLRDRHVGDKKYVGVWQRRAFAMNSTI